MAPIANRHLRDIAGVDLLEASRMLPQLGGATPTGWRYQRHRASRRVMPNPQSRRPSPIHLSNTVDNESEESKSLCKTIGLRCGSFILPGHVTAVTCPRPERLPTA